MITIAPTTITIVSTGNVSTYPIYQLPFKMQFGKNLYCMSREGNITHNGTSESIPMHTRYTPFNGDPSKNNIRMTCTEGQIISIVGYDTTNENGVLRFDKDPVPFDGTWQQ